MRDFGGQALENIRLIEEPMKRFKQWQDRIHPCVDGKTSTGTYQVGDGITMWVRDQKGA